MNKCEKCESVNIHKYNDCILCFDCKHKIILKIVSEAGIKRNYNVGSSFDNKLSGNKGGTKRYFVGNK